MTGIAALCGALGLVAVGFGLLSTLLLVAGAPTDLSWILANFLLGLVLLGVWLVGSLDALRERLHTGEARRVGRFGTSAVAQTVLLLVILGMLGFLANRHHVRFDWTESKVHSLSDQTRKVLAGLDEDVDVIAFYPALEAGPVRDLLDRYAYESERFHVQFADPNARPDLVERYGIAPEKLEEGLVRVEVGGQSVELDEVTEEKLTNALLRLTGSGPRKVYFLEGHNERPAEGEGAEEATGFSRAADALRSENYETEPLLLAAAGDVPEDASAVVIPGPTRPLHGVEHAALARYLARGGAVLAMVDPRARTDLVADLERWGVALHDDVVVDRVQGMFGQAMTPFAAEYGDHPITRGLREPTLFHVVRSVKARPEAQPRFTEIVRTSEHSWAETNLAELFSSGRAELDEADLPGPVPIAVAGSVPADAAGAQPLPEPELPPVSAPGEAPEGEAAQPAQQDAAAAAGGDDAGAAEGSGASAEGEAPPAEGRLVVFGDSDFASNQLLDSYRNRDLFVNSVNWLVGDVEAISIRPARSRASRLQLTAEQFSQLRYLALFVLPEAIAFLGAFVWWWRRRAPGR